MGYFTNGFVFTSEPDFEAIAGTLPGRSVQGYKHNERGLWLLDVWKSRGKLRRHSPFCDPAADGFRFDLATVDDPTQTFLRTFQRLTESVGHSTPGPEMGNAHLALSVAAAARFGAFFFAADDEETDMGCRAVPGSLVSFSCRLDRLSVHYSNGQLAVTPLNVLEDDDDDEFQELITMVRGVVGVVLQQPREIEGGHALYENPVREWPKEVGDPAAILGLGTWDPLVNVESDFSVVFERMLQ